MAKNNSINPEDFHAHLDGCSHCRENIFNLCPAGHVLLTGEEMTKAQVLTWMRNELMRRGDLAALERAKNSPRTPESIARAIIEFSLGMSFEEAIDRSLRKGNSFDER